MEDLNGSGQDLAHPNGTTVGDRLHALLRCGDLFFLCHGAPQHRNLLAACLLGDILAPVHEAYKMNVLMKAAYEAIRELHSSEMMVDSIA